MFLEIFAKETVNSVLVGVLAAVVVAVLYYIKHVRKYPPGPYGVPLLGYLPFMTKRPYLKFTELSKKYGPVFSLSIGTETVILLCDYSIIKKAFIQDATMGRPPNTFFNLSKETIETGAISNMAWKDQRRYALHTLRDLGFGKTQMEIHIREEIEELMERFEKEGGKPILATDYLTPSVSNNIASLMFGKRRKFDDPRRIMLDTFLNETRDLIKVSVLISFIPGLPWLFKKLNIGSQKRLFEVEEEFKDYMKEEIAEHKKTLDPNNIRDFIDGYLLEIKKKERDEFTSFKEPVLHDIIGAFFGGGSETIRLVVEWLILISAAYPDVQKRVQSEIDAVIGSERFPSRVDYLKMPFTEAVILEMFRWRASLPLNLPRYTLEDMEVDSYFLPKNTQIIAVFWAMNHDPKLWGEDADEFNPKRFLSEDETQIRRPEHFFPFSTGKRSCPGEALANVAVFMYFTAILQKFHLSLPKGAKPDFEGELVFGLNAKPQKVCFEPRSDSSTST